MALILIVDDDPTMRRVASYALKSAGHEVLEAGDGTEGLEFARVRRPELILCDVVMPGISGFEFVAALRQEEGISDMPVIMLTAMGERAHMRTGMTSGADDYIAKPFAFDELLEAVQALLSKRKALHEGLVASMSTSFVAALDEQREILASQYEKRLISELNSRWERVGDHDTELVYDDAVVMQVDIFGPLLARIAASADSSTVVRKAHQGARDALHLFSVQHLLASGNDLVAVFADEDESVRLDASTRALKAGFALAKAVSAALRPALDAAAAASEAAHVTIAMHRGSVKLLHVSDPLHGGPDSVLATGDTMSELASVRDFARVSGWQVAASSAVASTFGGRIVVDRSAQVMHADRSRPPIDVVEITALVS